MTYKWRLLTGIIFTIPLFFLMVNTFGSIATIIFLYLAFGWSRFGFILKPYDKQTEQLIIKNKETKMKKFITIIIAVMFISVLGCYEPDSTSGIYKVTTISQAEIYYTNGSGDTEKVITNGGEWIYTVELKEDKSPDPFYFNVYVLSTSGLQNISIYVEFEESNRDWYTMQENNVEELEYNSAYCAPWTTKCAKVTVHIQ